MALRTKTAAQVGRSACGPLSDPHSRNDVPVQRSLRSAGPHAMRANIRCWALTPAQSGDTDKCETRARTHCCSTSRTQRLSNCNSRNPRPTRAGPQPAAVTWLILPVVICLSQRLSHACLSISIVQRNCRRLIKTVMVYLMVHCYLDNRSNSRANTCTKERLTKLCIY